uniref:Neur_chan_LBD domain-containing protein n=1 Tax=Parastrongyloides trichosuri TaxID=131310 RepID=A0A0N4ZNW4_PARTI
MKIVISCLFVFLIIFYLPEKVDSSVSIDELKDGAKTIVPGTESESSSVEIIQYVNSTYGEDSSNLHKAIFKNYTRKIIPIRNPYQPLDVFIYLYINHITVNQREQTMTVHGQLYSTWSDEFATWDPSEFNNIRQTYARFWDIWTPDFRVANSAGGIYSYFDINKRTHATLAYVNANKTKVEITPTFSIKIGCVFDFTRYPFDEQVCSIRLFVLEPMTRIKLKVYYDLNPTIHLSWGHKDNKTMISDWEFVSVSNNITYHINGNHSLTPPKDPLQFDFSWSLYSCFIKIRRYSGYFFSTCILPYITCWLINTSTFFIHDRHISICISLINLIVQSVFINDTIYQIPPSNGSTPIYSYCICLLMISSALTLFLHLLINVQKKLINDNEGEEQSLIPNIIDEPVVKYINCHFFNQKTSKPPTHVSSLARGIPDLESVTSIETTTTTPSTSDSISVSSCINEEVNDNVNNECSCTFKIRYLLALIHFSFLIIILIILYF